ncbi:hypothetical protein [Nonomuraea sp. NEAU-A123]|uniref:hypothetical protein n=1 Tax=Nonomuraea sp. NEAU-A123 TaxID=2839649 RepID=UPI0035ABBEA2
MGAAIAGRLAAEGAKVVIAARTVSRSSSTPGQAVRAVRPHRGRRGGGAERASKVSGWRVSS